MNLWSRIAALVALFVVAVIGAAFATDAIRTTDIPGAAVAVAADVSAPASASDSIPVMVPVWVDRRPQADDPDPVPETVEISQTESVGGIQVVQPIASLEDVVPPVDTGPIDVEEIDAIAEETAEEHAEEGSPSESAPDPTEPIVGVPPVDPTRIAFVDPCSVVPQGPCPPGVPALVTLGDPLDRFTLVATTFKGQDGRFDGNGADRCPTDFEAGAYNVALRTSIPASIDVSYMTKTVPPRFITKGKVTRPESPEYERWVTNVAEGTLDENDSATWYRTCMSLTLDPGHTYPLEPIIAYADDGRVTELGYVPHIDTRSPSVDVALADGSLGRPPVSVVPTRGQNVSVYVWSRGPDDGYRTVAWPIDTSLPDAPSCSDVEADIFVGRQYGTEHSDLGSKVFGVIPIIERQPPAVYDPQWHWLQRFDLSLREGHPYTLCTWEARLGGNSFDNWEILERQQTEISAPNSHPIVMTLSEVTLRDTSTTHDVHVYTTNHIDFCDQRGPILNATVERAHEGTQQVREVFCETRGLQPEPTAFVRVTVDSEVVDVLAIPLDATQGCERGGPDPACSTPFAEYFVTTVEVPGSCPSGCGSIDLQIRVDYLASGGLGIDRWQRGDRIAFEGTPPSDDAGPQIDTVSLDYSPVQGRTDALLVSFLLNRPAEFTITAGAVGMIHDRTCDGNASGSGEGQVEIVIEGLCADTLYGLQEITLIDADGVAGVQDLRGGADSVKWTNGYASWFQAKVRLREVFNEAAATTRCRDMDSSANWADVADDCWQHLGSQTEGSVENVLAFHSETKNPSPRCFDPSQTGISVWAPPVDARTTGTVVHGDTPYVILHARPEVRQECGSAKSTLGFGFARLFVERGFSIDELDDGVTIEESQNGLMWEIEITRTDKGIGHRLDQ